MSDRRIKLVIEAKNMLAGGLNSASNSLQKFSDKAKSGGFSSGGLKAGVIGAVVAGITAVAAASIKSVAAFIQQEKAERNLADAIKMHGESVTEILPKLNAFSNKMQDEAGVGDEITMQRMANMKAMGMQTDMIEQAAKAVAALTRAGMGEEAAQRALVAATQGNFEALGRYIPALKNARTETEKAKAVNDFISAQWHMQKKDLDTLGGSWSMLKNRIGDFSEESGRKLSKFFKLKELFTGLGNAIKNLTPSNEQDIAKMAADYDKAANETKEKFDLAQADIVKAEEEASKRRQEIAKEETDIKKLLWEEQKIQFEIEQKAQAEIARKTVRELIDAEKEKRKSRGLSVADQRKFDALSEKERKGGFMFKSDKAFLDEARRKQRESEGRGDDEQMAKERKRFDALQAKMRSGGVGLGLKNIKAGALTAEEKLFVDSFTKKDNARELEQNAQNNLDQIARKEQIAKLDDIKTALENNQKALEKLLKGG